MDEKYLVDGRAVEVIAKLPDDRYLVDLAFEYDDETYFAAINPFIVDRVFDEPPTLVLNQKVAELNAEISRLEERKRELASEIERARKANDAQMAEFAKYDQLRELKDFIAGKVTHYLIPDMPEIVSQKEISEYDRFPKLLTLYGKSDGNLRWNLNTYSDGSGGNKEVIPCLGYEDALAKAQALVSASENGIPSGRLLDFAQKYGLKIRHDYAARLKKSEAQNLLHEIQRHETEIAKLRAKLEAD